MARRAKRKRRRGGRRRRRNAGMPVVLVNPRGGGRRRRRRRRRRNPFRARRRSYRRRNPRASFTGALMATGLGLVGGALAYGMEWGVSHMKTSHTVQSLALGGVGLATSVGVAMLADERAAAGIAGGTGALLVGRIREGIALARLEKPADKKGESKTPAESGRVYRQPYDAGAVLRRENPFHRVTGARSLGARGMPAPTFKDAGAVFRETGASRYVAGPVRWYGPHSWAYDTRETGRVVRRYVSAHSASR